MLELNKKKADIEGAVAQIVKNPKLLAEVLDGVASEEVPLKFQCQKVLREISSGHPALLYPHWDFLVTLLDSANTFIKANAVNVLGTLTSVDQDHKFEELLPKFYQMMQAGSMITAGNIASISGVIAKNKPHLQKDIVSHLVNIDRTRHSPECKNVIKGKAILALSEFFPEVENKNRVLTFVRGELENTRKGTRRKAEQFLKRWDTPR